MSTPTGPELRAWRKYHGMTMAAAAKALGYSGRGSIYAIETGRNKATARTRLAMDAYDRSRQGTMSVAEKAAAEARARLDELEQRQNEGDGLEL